MFLIISAAKTGMEDDGLDDAHFDKKGKSRRVRKGKKNKANLDDSD